MAARNFTSNSSFSFERMPVRLMGSATQSGSTGVAAVKVTQGITITANVMGSAGNSITIAFTAGATAGAEVVTVAGNAISVQIETGVSTVTQVRTAINAAPAAAALVTASGTNVSTVVTASALPLLTGADTVFTVVGLSSITVTQTATGEFKLACADKYKALIGISIMIQKAAATDIMPQIISSDVTTDKAVKIRTIAGATPTNLASGDILFITMELRNSSS